MSVCGRRSETPSDRCIIWRSLRACSAPSFRGLAHAGCATDARVIVEKPFGRDLASAKALNRTLHEVFSRIVGVSHRSLPR